MRVLNISRGPRGLAFPPALWISLAVVLACALMPAGAPRTRMVGSAFDPSTVMVALKLKSERPRHVRPEAARPGRKLPPPIPMEAGYGLIQPVPAALQRGLAARAEAEIPPHIAPRHSDTIRDASLARAPPAA